MGHSGVETLLLCMLRVKGKLLGAKAQQGSLGDWFVFEELGVVVKRGPLVTVGE